MRACKARLPVLDDQIIKVTNDHIQAVIDYFEYTYNIGRFRPGGHRVPLFNIGLWNMYNQTLDDLPRTNNAVEGWFRNFQASVGAYHPNFWKFIDILKREQNLTQVSIAMLQPVISQNLNVDVIWTATRGSKTSSKTTTTVTSCSIFRA